MSATGFHTAKPPRVPVAESSFSKAPAWVALMYPDLAAVGEEGSVGNSCGGLCVNVLALCAHNASVCCRLFAGH